MKQSVVVLFAAFVAGCASVQPDRVNESGYYFGIVHVAFPKTRGAVTAVDARVLGVGFDGAAFVGWRDSKFVFSRPDQCGAIVVIRNPLEMASVVKILNALGENPCIADFSRSLPSAVP